MHPEQYRNYKSGQAKKNFEADLQKAKDAKMATQGLSAEQIAAYKHADSDAIIATETGKVLWEVCGAEEGRMALEPFIGKHYDADDTFCIIETGNGQLVSVPANLGGRIVDIAVNQGSTVRRGDTIGYIRRD